MNGTNCAEWLRRVRQQRPLVHNITNLVVTNIAANALLAIGASPVMAYAPEEVGDMARIASALALNMGTLDNATVDAMLIAGNAAKEAGTPIVFDPVGVGATAYRTKAAEKIASSLPLAILRGNAGEMGVMVKAGGQVRGVDALSASATLPDAMRIYSQAHGCIVVATGATDIVTDGQKIWHLHNGDPLLATITGSGCMATAVMGAFLGVVGREGTQADFARAAVAALTCYNIAGEMAAKEAKGPGTFQAALFDALYSLTENDVKARAKIDNEG